MFHLKENKIDRYKVKSATNKTLGFTCIFGDNNAFSLVEDYVLWRNTIEF